MTDTGSLLRSALGLRDGETPFPWQRILLHRFVEGRVPSALDIPTGLGKTGTMAVWLVARCMGAPLPRRLVYVVDRRAVVDQATREAERLGTWLEQRPAQKESLGLEPTQTLPISTLRGHLVDNREWLEDPSRPAIIVGTVDMVGSRLLFEGYGVSRRMRPYHAGLLGCDALIVLDEAHLVPPFEELVRAVARRVDRLGGVAHDPDYPIPGLTLLPLSATGRAAAPNALRLDEDEEDPDSENEEVRRRIRAMKRLTVHEIEQDSLQPALVERAWSLTEGGSRKTRVVVYCNAREVAERVATDLRERIDGWKEAHPADVPAPEVALLVGARRVRERSLVARELVRLGFETKPPADAEPPIEAASFLVATSAGEVGVDLDAEHMVSDLVSWDRMVQRLGRVNRRGRQEAQVHVYVEPLREKSKPSPRQQAAHAARRTLVQGLPLVAGGGFDASPGALALRTEEVRGTDLLRNGTSARPLRPALDRATVEAWSATSLKDHTGRPPVEPWLRGWVDDPPQTRVAFRARLPRAESHLTAPEYGRYFAAAPIHTSEVLETETCRVSDWLFARAKTVTRRLQKRSPAKAVGTPPETSAPWAFLLDSAGELVCFWSLDYLAAVARQKKNARDHWHRALFGHTLVVDAAIGGLERGLLAVSVQAPPTTADEGEDWLDPGPAGEPVVPFRVIETTSVSALVDGNWREHARIPLRRDDEGNEAAWLVIQRWKSDSALEDERSAGPLQPLSLHQGQTVLAVAGFVRRLGLPHRLGRMLSIAARLHDEGKRAAHWQRAFSAPAGGPYAKTPGPFRRGFLHGYRHEFGSLTHVREDAEFRSLTEDDQDLVLHLVAAHHGFARPLLRPDSCQDAPPSVLRDRSREVALRFYRLQERLGPWGLAWLESLLRAADQQASRSNVEGSVARKEGAV